MRAWARKSSATLRTIVKRRTLPILGATSLLVGLLAVGPAISGGPGSSASAGETCYGTDYSPSRLITGTQAIHHGRIIACMRWNESAPLPVWGRFGMQSHSSQHVAQWRKPNRMRAFVATFDNGGGFCASDQQTNKSDVKYWNAWAGVYPDCGLPDYFQAEGWGDFWVAPYTWKGSAIEKSPYRCVKYNYSQSC